MDRSSASMSNSKQQSSGRGGGRSGGSFAFATRTWKFWRHICCVHGWYPLAVAAIALAAFLLSLYSTMGCDYIAVDIGFTPSNAAYNKSQVNLGFFYIYRLQDEDSVVVVQEAHSNPLVEAFHSGCNLYSNLFQQDFIYSDRTWRVARIMAIIAASAGLAGTIVAWLMVVTPLSASIFWPTLLLPLVMLSFIAEGSKFLLFDVSICRNSIWLPSGVDSMPQTADSCGLGTSAIYGIVSGSLFLVALLMVCLYTPQRRILDPNYGQDFLAPTSSSNHDVTHLKCVADDTEAHLEGSSSSDNILVDTAGEAAPEMDHNSPARVRDVESSDLGEDDIYTTAGTISENQTMNSEPPSFSKSDRSGGNGSRQGGSCGRDSSSPATTVTAQSHAGEFPPERISESRLSKMEKLELRQASHYQPLARSNLLHQLVSELNDSLSVSTSTGNSATSTSTASDIHHHQQPSPLLAQPTSPAGESNTIQRFL